MDEKARVKMMPALGFLGRVLGITTWSRGMTRADERHDESIGDARISRHDRRCARCHNHKYDPFHQGLLFVAGVFASTVYHEYPQMPQT